MTMSQNKKFRPKNKLLQYDLDAFLYWRFQICASNGNMLSTKVYRETFLSNNPIRKIGLWEQKEKKTFADSLRQRFGLTTNPTSPHAYSRTHDSLSQPNALPVLHATPYPKRLSSNLEDPAYHRKLATEGLTHSNSKSSGGFSIRGSFGRSTRRSSLRTDKTNKGSGFFPEKKDFMQFWALPLLGASLLSFVTMEQKGLGLGISMDHHFQKNERFKQENFLKNKNEPLFGWIERPNFVFSQTGKFRSFESIPLNTMKANSTEQKEIYKLDVPVFTSSQNTSFYKKTPWPLSPIGFEKDKLNETRINQMEDLCKFYLNLTQEKLGSTFDSQKQKNLARISTSLDVEKTVWLKYLYVKNAAFHWNFYPLYHFDLVSNGLVKGKENQNEIFLQKLNPGVSFSWTKENEVKNTDMLFGSSQEKENLTEKSEALWKKHPTLSYLKSTEFFEQWLLKLRSFKLHPQNINHMSDLGTKNWEPFLNANEDLENSPSLTRGNEKALKDYEQKTKILEFFTQFLETFHEQRTLWIKTYDEFQFQQIRQQSPINQEKLSRQMLENFEKKYACSINRLTFQKKEARAQDANPSLCDPTVDLGVLNLSKQAGNEPIPMERTKNLKKWTQEIQLYSQLQKIQKTFMDQLNLKTRKNSDLLLSRPKKSPLSFAKKQAYSTLKKTTPFHTSNLHKKQTYRPTNPDLTWGQAIPSNLLHGDTPEVSITSRSQNQKLSTSSLELRMYASKLSRTPKIVLNDCMKKLEEKVSKTNMESWIWNSANWETWKTPKRFQLKIDSFEKKKKDASVKIRFSRKRNSVDAQTNVPKQHWRKSEKFFRSYVSIKNVKALQNKKSTDFFLRIQDSGFQKNTSTSTIYKILRQLKNHALFSNSNLPLLNPTQPKKLCFPEREYVNPEALNIERQCFDAHLHKEILKEKAMELKKLQDFLFLKKANFLKNATPLATDSVDTSLIFPSSQILDVNTFLEEAKQVASRLEQERQKIQGKQNGEVGENLSDELKVFEKKKNLEKKRRLKKLKLENRRRKKRKRFYPRPQILRFECYLSFLQKRHINQSKQLKPKSFSIPISQVKHKLRSSTLFYKDLSRNSKSLSVAYTDFSTSIYDYGQKVKKPSGLADSSFKNGIHLKLSRPGTWQNKKVEEIPHQKEFYKISNQTLTEFERLCWKSYWLRSNLKPYVLKIQKSLKRMKEIENFKTSQQVPIFLKDSSQSQNGSFSKISPSVTTYVNVRENLQSGRTSFSDSWELSAQKAEYERLLYDRINDEIKNVKSQLTVDGQSQARSYKRGRQKFEKTPTKPFWNAPYEFSNHYLEPSLETATSVWNPPYIKTDMAKKDFPTLRLLWACQKSQLFSYQSNNFAQNLWTTYKTREQTKNNKTRKFFYRFSRKIFDFKQWIQVSQPTIDESNNVDEKNSDGSTQQPRNSTLSPLCSSDIDSRNLRIRNTSSNKRKLKFDEPHNDKQIKLQNLAAFKTNRVNQKIQTFGGSVSGKNYHAYLKHLKLQLQQNPLSKKELFGAQKSNNSSQRIYNQLPWIDSNLHNSIQKHPYHFWWSVQKPSFPFLLSFLFSQSENVFFYPEITSLNTFGTSFEQLNPSLTFDQKEWLAQSFWLCTCMLHVGIFFALIRVPEIRSLVKFQVLLFSKLCNAYLLGLFAFYDLFKRYMTQIQRLSKNVLKISNAHTSNASAKKMIQGIHSLKLFPASRDGRSNIHSARSWTPHASRGSERANRHGVLTGRSWVQSTVHWSYVSKPFFDAREHNLNRTLKSIDETFVLFKKSTQPNALRVYYSWSTRFMWSMVLKNFDSRKFQLDKKQVKADSISSMTPAQIILSDSARNERSSIKTIKTMASQNKGYAIGSPQKRPDIATIPTKNQRGKEGLESKIQIQAFLSLGILWTTSFCVSTACLCFNGFYKIVFQVIDLMEGTLFLFYKFLEKPAEVLVDWIAEVFLVEWISDIHAYVPEAFDTAMWSSLTKVSRGTRFFYALPFGFVAQRFFLESTQLFYQWVLKPDSDLRIRQKKGIIFWDIWSEILIQAAEKYKMNLSSLSTIKEEQELLIENLLQSTPSSTTPHTSTLATPLGLTSPTMQGSGSQIDSTTVSEAQESDQKEKQATESVNSVLSSRKTEKSRVEAQKLTEKRTERSLSMNRAGLDFRDQAFQTSLRKFNPLMKFIQNRPSFYEPSKIIMGTDAKYPLAFFKNQSLSNLELRRRFESVTVDSASRGVDVVSIQHTQSMEDNKGFSEMLSENFKENSLKRWSVTQYLNTQGKDTDLFMDIHPAKCFEHVSFLKSSLPAQEILGSLVCEIYAGLFSSKVSKNVLIVGAPGITKSFFIQALAGETELKLVLDNAHRYAFVHGGVPVGMKLLREVFESMALHTPCLFLLEDVHVIGERRPMLISDDETSKTKDFAFGAEQEEVHEKNKLVYQLSKHALSHYKKPYKGDFSQAISTNHFCYDLFLGISPPRKRRADLTASSPLPIQALESALDPSTSSGESFSQEARHEGHTSNKSQVPPSSAFLSSLQISIGQVFAPPATSPFHVLLMKEQKKLKPKKFVQDVPWSGLSYDQWMLLSKSNYSVRVKVALLAETAMKNLSVKLDMITDLLVIIDSVRSNRGFVVFATTHVPALLDPALRRPGRLDETISLPLLPNIETRFEILRTRLSAYTECMDFFDWSLYSGQLTNNETQLAMFLNKNILALLNSKFPSQFISPMLNPESSNSFSSPHFQNFQDYPIFSLCQAFQSSLSLQSLWANGHQLKKMLSGISEQLLQQEHTQLSNFLPSPKTPLSNLPPFTTSSQTPYVATSPLVALAAEDPLATRGRTSGAKREMRSEKPQAPEEILYGEKKGDGSFNEVSECFSRSTLKRNYVALSYGQTGQFLTEALRLKDQTTYTMKFVGNLGLSEYSQADHQKFMFQSLYGSSFETKETLFKLLAAKISEFFVFAHLPSFPTYHNRASYGVDQRSAPNRSELAGSTSRGPIFSPLLNSAVFNPDLLKFEKTIGALEPSQRREKAISKEDDFSTNSHGTLKGLRIAGLPSSNLSNSVPYRLLLDHGAYEIGSSVKNVQSSVKNWQSATSFLDGIFQKRYLYNKNSIVLKMLFVEDKVSLAEPPSPPNSSILNPARKFENYQKTLRDFIQKPGLTINQKLQMHQKQRFLKLLYNIPISINSSTSSSSSSPTSTPPSDSVNAQNFYTSFKELGYLDLVTLRPSSTYAFYKTRWFQRQRFSFLNQWWNGQLAEHNAETTYLSHIDWRSMFVPSLGDVFLDFPDAEQYYNPRNRRWFLQSKTWSYWFNFEKERKQQISEHFLIECFTQTSELLNNNRELVDSLAYCFLRNHQLHELDLLQVLVRFYKNTQIEI